MIFKLSFFFSFRIMEDMKREVLLHDAVAAVVLQIPEDCE